MKPKNSSIRNLLIAAATLAVSSFPLNAATIDLDLSSNNAGSISLDAGDNTFSFTGFSVDYLIVGGGGGGGGATTSASSTSGGGGGAGGLLQGTTQIGGVQSIIVGDGGVGGNGGTISQTQAGQKGGNSSAFSLTAEGGGGGGRYDSNGGNGGSGGGAAARSSATGGAGGTGVPGQGFDGGSRTSTSGNNGGAGGGGAGGAGDDNISNSTGRAGGAGVASSITGTSVTYAGGGGGGGTTTTAGASDTGGTGGTNAARGADAFDNTGGGGGGGGTGDGRRGGAGGTGTVVVSYSGPQVLSGGAVSTNDGNTIHQFLDTGSTTLGFNATIKGTLSGAGNLIWDGGGTLTLAGTNTYTGTTTITTGTLVITGATLDTSSITFDAGGQGILGLDTGVSVTAANAAIDLTDGAIKVTGTPSATSYTLLTASSITGTPVLAEPITGYELQVVGNELLLVDSGGPQPPTSSYDDWAEGAPFDDDASGDGIANGMAFLLGSGAPAANALDLLPTSIEDNGGLILTFSMRNAAERGDATLSVEYGSDLAGWTTVVIPDAEGVTVDGDITFDITTGTPLNSVTATISSAAANGGGKLFARLNGQNPTNP